MNIIPMSIKAGLLFAVAMTVIAALTNDVRWVSYAVPILGIFAIVVAVNEGTD